MDSINEEFIDSIITNLKIISILQINEKLGIRKGHLVIDRDSNIQSIKRWFNRDSRDIILNYIKDLVKNISTAFNKIKTLPHEDYTWNLSRILIEMDSIETGLNNLKTTYSDDPVTIAQIDNIIIKCRETMQRARKNLIPPEPSENNSKKSKVISNI
jgi:hypothetical protein